MKPTSPAVHYVKRFRSTWCEMRNHTIRVVFGMRSNTELVERLKRDARAYAGSHPGVIVTIKVQNELRGWDVLARFSNVSGRKYHWE